MKIRILLADDQALVRQGIRQLLELTPDFEVVGEASDGDEALALIAHQAADVLLLDVRMPHKTGLDVLRVLKAQKQPAPAAILLTTFDDDAVALEGIRLGARGFLLKDITLEQLTSGIRAVASGGTLINPAVTERVLRGLQRLEQGFEASELPDPLTPRETEVLRLMAAGSSNREIAEALGMAEGTAKNHASSILSKLGVRDRTRAVLRALELGYL
ncbi:MAG: response regulator transcription factor [Polyangiaceae bacterium]|nr:response regulator transcription factor [Polyangiaceae bacterium]MCB9609500.1 response regulator transcription factor [Polyangiaceae bacterium]